MPIPAAIVLPAIELAFQIIERAIASGELTTEAAVKRVAATQNAANASEANLDRAIADAEAVKP